MEWLDRFVNVMDVISNSGDEGIGVTDISNLTDLSKGTLHRMLRDMVEQNLLTQSKITKKYKLGVRAMVWGSKFILGQDPAKILSGYCDLLAEQTNLYTYLCRFESGQVYCIYTQQPEHVRQKYFVHVGQRIPLHCGAAAKAILAFQPMGEVISLMSNEPAIQFTEFTKLELLDRVKELETVKSEGVSFCIEELEMGVSAISTPILLERGEAYFSISLVSSADYIEQHKQRLMVLLKEIGLRASEHLQTAAILDSTSHFE